MKKVLLIATLVALLASPAFALISGSAHDFSSQTWTNNPNNEICVACHTPHGGSMTVTQAPLWNHTLTAAASTAYQRYTGPGTLNATDVSTTPSGISRLCLSCHDGTVNVDAFSGAAGGSTISGYANLFDGTNGMQNDHPVSFTYGTTLVGLDSGLRPVTTLSGITTAGTIDSDMLFGTTAGSKTLECASCHDVHNGANISKLLVKSNAGSALCLTCHAK